MCRAPGFTHADCHLQWSAHVFYADLGTTFTTVIYFCDDSVSLFVSLDNVHVTISLEVGILTSDQINRKEHRSLSEIFDVNLHCYPSTHSKIRNKDKLELPS